MQMDRVGEYVLVHIWTEQEHLLVHSWVEQRRALLRTRTELLHTSGCTPGCSGDTGWCRSACSTDTAGRSGATRLGAHLDGAGARIWTGRRTSGCAASHIWARRAAAGSPADPWQPLPQPP